MGRTWEELLDPHHPASRSWCWDLDPGFPTPVPALFCNTASPFLGPKKGTRIDLVPPSREPKAAGGSTEQGLSQEWPRALPHQAGAPQPHGSHEPLPVGTSEGAHLLQCVHHGLEVHALGEFFLPSARAKKDRRSEGGLPGPVQPSDTMQHPPRSSQSRDWGGQPG